MMDSSAYVVAHRGFSAIHPDNTLESFRAAIDAGVHAIECDVRLSADAVPLLVHSRWLRCPGGRGLSVESLSEQAVQAAMAPRHLPTLVDLLRLVDGLPVRVYADLKAPTETTLRVVQECALACEVQPQMTLAVKLTDALRLPASMTNPALPVCVYTHYPFRELDSGLRVLAARWDSLVEVALFFPRMGGSQFYRVLESASGRAARAVERCKTADKLVAGGVCNTCSAYEWLSELGIARLWTDDPELIMGVAGESVHA
jgi:glycerophosphoryl diester phosphodiesterase